MLTRFANLAASVIAGVAAVGGVASAATGVASLSSKTIKDVQQRLVQTGYLQGEKPNGDWGPKTAAAVKLFQKDYGLTPSGNADSETLAALGVKAKG